MKFYHLIEPERGLLALPARHHSREPDHGQDDGRHGGLLPGFEFSENLRTRQVRIYSFTYTSTQS